MTAYDNNPADAAFTSSSGPETPPEDAFRREVTAPDDYIEVNNGDAKAAETAFLADLRKVYYEDQLAESDNRIAAMEDMRFVAGDQWAPGVRQARMAKGRPVITINRIPAFVAQVVNQRRMNEVSIRVLPDEGGDRGVARIRQGLIRSIEKMSRAKIAYQKAHENQVICGDGAFQLALRYAANDVFQQDIVIEPIANPLAVLWDRMSVDPTGSDARHVFVEDLLSTDEFKKLYPNAKITSFDPAAVPTAVRDQGWFTVDTVRVVSYWRMRHKMRRLAMLMGGGVVDVTDMAPEQWVERTMLDAATGRPLVRVCDVPYAELYVSNGVELLDGPYALQVSRLPVFRASGWDINVGDRRLRWGLVRNLKDPQRMHNYWRSVMAERLMQTPRAVWLTPNTAIEGYEKAFRSSAETDDPVLVFNAEAGTPPQRVQPAQLEPAMLQEAELGVRDMRDVSGIHEASLGQVSNEVSGRAIVARQRVGELGTAVFQDNLNLAIEECGRVINDLIPHVYNTERTIVTLGEDDAEEVVRLGQENGGVDLGVGRYRVSVTTGPSFITKRIEAAESMLNMVNAVPQAMAPALDKIIEAQDWPGADEIARRLRASLPDELVDPRDMSPQEQQMRMQMAQAKAAQGQLQQRMAEAEVAMKEAQVAEHTARAQEAAARAAVTIEKAKADIGSQRLNDAIAALTAVKELQTPMKETAL